MAGLANEMEMPRLPVGVLEAEPAFAEIDLPRDAGIHHPLQRAVNSGAADAVIVLADQIDEIVGAEMTFLTQEHIDNLLPLAGALAARWRQSAEIREGTHEATLTFLSEGYTLNDDPHPHVDVAFGFLIVNPPPVTVSTKSTSAPLR